MGEGGTPWREWAVRGVKRGEGRRGKGERSQRMKEKGGARVGGSGRLGGD